MKIIITLLFLLLLSSPSWSKTMRDLVQRDGVYYKKFSDVPFSGKVTGSFNGSITNGKREGAWICYYVGGQLHYKGNYKNGKMEGEWITYHRKGQLNSKGNYKNGKREGAWVEFHDDGQLGNKGNYKNGVKISDWQTNHAINYEKTNYTTTNSISTGSKNLRGFISCLIK